MSSNLKTLVRARMASAKENYTTALRWVRAQRVAGMPPAPPEPEMSPSERRKEMARWQSFWGEKKNPGG